MPFVTLRLNAFCSCCVFDSTQRRLKTLRSSSSATSSQFFAGTSIGRRFDQPTECSWQRRVGSWKPFGEGLPHEIWKIVEDYDGDTYWAVYTAAFPEVVYVLDVFMKKSKSGIKTPQMDKDRVRDRFKAAKRDYDANYRKRGGK